MTRLTCTSTHCERAQECRSPHECSGSAKYQPGHTYRGWNVHYDNPPIPIRSMDWSATSPDYDVDCDEDGFFVCAGQQVHAATYDELIAEIDAHIAEQGQ